MTNYIRVPVLQWPRWGWHWQLAEQAGGICLPLNTNVRKFRVTARTDSYIICFSEFIYILKKEITFKVDLKYAQKEILTFKIIDLKYHQKVLMTLLKLSKIRKKIQ